MAAIVYQLPCDVGTTSSTDNYVYECPDTGTDTCGIANDFPDEYVEETERKLPHGDSGMSSLEFWQLHHTKRRGRNPSPAKQWSTRVGRAPRIHARDLPQ